MAANQATKSNTETETKPEARQEVAKSKDGGTKKKSSGLFSFLLPMLLVVSIICGIWAYFIKANKFGLGERFRGNLKNIPIVRMILPPNPDPEAAEYMSDDELASKYEEYRKKAKDYEKQIEEQKKTIQDLQKYKDNDSTMRSQTDTYKTMLDKEKKNIDNQKKQLQNDKLKFATAVKNADKTGFAQFYEKMDKDTAKLVYEQVLKENQLSTEVSDYVKTFELMEPANAASVLENMGVGNVDLVANIMKKMKKQSSAQILANMDPVFAANLADTMAIKYPIYPKN